MTDLTKLAERVEALTGPDREVDAEIEALFTDERGCRPIRFFRAQVATGQRRPLRFTESLDAAMTLIPETGFAEINIFNGHADCGASVTVWSIYGEEFCEHIEAATPALALAAACLRAIGSKNDD